MKLVRFLSACCLLLSAFISPAQTIHGKVIDKVTGEAIANASVYYNGAMGGTLTDSRGEFDLPSKTTKIPFIISCLGYFSAVVSDYVPGHDFTILLDPKIEQLRVITLRDDGMSRENKVKLFTREFIGTSPYAQSCIISNINDIDLAWNRKTGTLSASCDGPIQIENIKLGYHIDYFMDSFEKNTDWTVFSGHFIFKERQRTPSKIVAENRKKCYNGSRMQFIRALWTGSLVRDSYTLYESLNHPLDPADLLSTDSLGQTVVNLPQRVIISHSGSYSFSYLEQDDRDALIDAEGFYDTKLHWIGLMAAQRTGDLLPFDYQVKPEKKPAGADSVAATQALAKQKLNDDQRLIVSMVMSPDLLMPGRKVIMKWQSPIHYKLYGSSGNPVNDEKIAADLDHFMDVLSGLTGLEISKQEGDSPVNFAILLGKHASEFAGSIRADALNYLQPLKTSGYYYVPSENGILDMVQFINLDDKQPGRPLLTAIKKQVLSGLGFTSDIYEEGFENSIFFWKANGAANKMEPIDQRIIRALYRPEVKAGMTESQFIDSLLELKL